MRQYAGLMLFTLLAPQPILAKTKIDVASFANSTSAGACNAVAPWQKDIEEAFRQQLIHALNDNGFTVVEPELYRGEKRAAAYDSGVSNMHTKNTFKAAKYSINASLKTFDICEKDSTVAVEIKVTDVKSGQLAQTFVSHGRATNRGPAAQADYKGATFNTGLFKDSPIGKATTAAIGDAADRLKKAYPDREIASEDYRIRTIRRSRSR